MLFRKGFFVLAVLSLMRSRSVQDALKVLSAGFSIRLPKVLYFTVAQKKELLVIGQSESLPPLPGPSYPCRFRCGPEILGTALSIARSLKSLLSNFVSSSSFSSSVYWLTSNSEDASKILFLPVNNYVYDHSLWSLDQIGILNQSNHGQRLLFSLPLILY